MYRRSKKAQTQLQATDLGEPKKDNYSRLASTRSAQPDLIEDTTNSGEELQFSNTS